MCLHKRISRETRVPPSVLPCSNSMASPGSPPPLVVLLRPPRVGRAEMRKGARVGRVGPRGEGSSMELARTDSLGHCFRRGWRVSVELRQPRGLGDRLRRCWCASARCAAASRRAERRSVELRQLWLRPQPVQSGCFFKDYSGLHHRRHHIRFGHACSRCVLGRRRRRWCHGSRRRRWRGGGAVAWTPPRCV